MKTKISSFFTIISILFGFNAFSASHYVDNVGNCSGLTTCYLTIQQALNNSVSNDEIRVFPGTYPETVDLTLMGSELTSAANGNITFNAVDTNNIPSVGTTLISPITNAAFIHSGSFFVGDVTIDGFNVLSADDDGIDLDLVSGDITITNVTASGNDSDGIDVEVSTGNHTITITNSITNNNLSNGLNLDGPDGTVINVIGAEANNNVGEGINIQSANILDAINVSIVDSETQDNGNMANDSAGVVVVSTGSLSVNNLFTKANHGPGLAIIDITDTTISDSIFEDNAIVEFFSGIFLVSAGEFKVTRSVFSGNGDSGINVYETDIIGNELTSFSVNCSTFTGNDVGIYLNNVIGTTSDVQLNHNNFLNQITAAIQAGTDNDAIDATNNWWSDASGPTHSSNPLGTGDRVSDSIDDAIGGAMGTVDFTPHAMSSIAFEQIASDTIFLNNFEGDFCSQL